MSDWGRTLRSGLSAAIETALNRALALDPATEQALRELLTEPFLIRLTPPGLALHLLADRRAVRVQFECAVPPALALSGSPLAYAAAATGDRQVFTDGRISVHGDVALAHRLQRILQQLEPDWEAGLADAIGGVPAHFLARRFRQGLRWSREARAALSRNLEEYLQEESDSLPARAEAEARFEDIDRLRLDGDRLEARVRLLEQEQDRFSAPDREQR